MREVDIGLAADMGTLQRLPKVVGNDGWVRDVVFTGRVFTAHEAAAQGLLTAVHPDRDAALAAAVTLAKEIAAKSPVAVLGSKQGLNYSRDHSVDDGLHYVAAWNAAMTNTRDIPAAISANLSKTRPTFSKL